MAKDKKIARSAGKGDRTVQRSEKREGLESTIESGKGRHKKGGSVRQRDRS
jgi:hypothetical protein